MDGHTRYTTIRPERETLVGMSSCVRRTATQHDPVLFQDDADRTRKKKKISNTSREKHNKCMLVYRKFESKSLGLF